MDRLVRIVDPERLGGMAVDPVLPAFDTEDLRKHSPDAHWVLLGRRGVVGGRCSLWWQGTPAYGDHRVGLIGHYAAGDGAAARRLLGHACEELAKHGCTLAVGPMDGNTWRRYRLMVQRGSEPVFFLEPDNPDEWPGHFSANGFEVLASYSSALTTSLAVRDPRLNEVSGRLAGQGVLIRPLDPGRFEEETQALYGLVLDSFRGNFLYTPISKAEFDAQYRWLRAYIRAELVLMAERDGRLIGCLFAVPNLLEAGPSPEEGRGGPRHVSTVILKTLAVHPDYRRAGLGALLVGRCHEMARGLGYSRAMHALIHERNNSQAISARYAQVMRRYALFAAVIRP